MGTNDPKISFRKSYQDKIDIKLLGIFNFFYFLFNTK